MYHIIRHIDYNAKLQCSIPAVPTFICVNAALLDKMCKLQATYDYHSFCDSNSDTKNEYLTRRNINT